MATAIATTEKPGPRPRRWWLFRPFDLLAQLWPVWRKRRGVLVVRIDGIGDMVLFHGAFAHYPEALDVALADITILGCKSWASLVLPLFPGCRFHAIDEHRYDKNPFYRLAVSLWVRRQGFAVATCDIFMRKPLVADALVHASGAPRKIVTKPYLSPKTQRLFDWYLGRCQQVIDTGPRPTHETLRHFRFISVLAGRIIAPEPPDLPWPRRASLPLSTPYVVLNFGANEPGRRWDFERFLAIAKELARRGLVVVFSGGSAEAGFKERLVGLPFIDWIGRTSLLDLMDLLQHATLVVSSETGPAHLAIGLGAPTVVIVGGGQFQGWMPFPESVPLPRCRFVYRERPCFYCLWNCTEPHERGRAFPCIDGVTEADVLAAIDSLIGKAQSGVPSITTLRS